MEPKLAAGILLYRLQKTPEFLLIQDSYSQRRHWTPPKGSALGKEDELRCALRHATELTGLSSKDIHVEEGHIYKLTYLSDSKPKKVTYFLAQISDFGKITPGSGINHKWCPPDQASERVVFRSMQDVLKKATEAIPEVIKAKINKQLATQGISPKLLGAKGFGRSGSSNQSQFSQSPRLGFSSSHSDSQRSEGRQGGLGSSPSGSGSPSSGSSSRPSSQASLADNPQYKTRLCKSFQNEGSCPYGPRCIFAHGEDELREMPRPKINPALLPPTSSPSSSSPSHFTSSFSSTSSSSSSAPEYFGVGSRSPLFKTRLCKAFTSSGQCEFGPRCTYAHGDHELREGVPMPDLPVGRNTFVRSTNGGSQHSQHNPSQSLSTSSPSSSSSSSASHSYPSQASHQPSYHSSTPSTSSSLHFQPQYSSSHSQPFRREQREGRETDHHPHSSSAEGSWRRENRSPSAEEERFSPEASPGVIESVPLETAKIEKPRADERTQAPSKKTRSPQIQHKREEKPSNPLKPGFENQENEKSWMKVVELTEDEKEKFRFSGDSGSQIMKKAEKLSLEEQLEKEFRVFFSQPHSLDEELKEVNRKEIKHDLTTGRLLSIILPALLSGDVFQNLQKRVIFFKNFTRKLEQQLAFLIAWEKFLARDPSFEGQVLHILKCLYENDLVEEEAFLSWDKQATGTRFHQKSSPFLKWLKSD